jgi:hypothetical protein
LETALGAVPWRPWDIDFDLIIISFAVRLFRSFAFFAALAVKLFCSFAASASFAVKLFADTPNAN